MAARLALGITDAGRAFTLPAGLVSQSTAILAKRRVGKSYLRPPTKQELETGMTKISAEHPPEGLTGPEQRILDAVFWWEALNVYHPAAAAVAPLADYSVKSSGFEKARGMLKVKKLVTFNGTELSLTPEGRRLARGEGPPPTTLELHRRVLETLTEPEKRVLDPLLRSYPGELSFEELAVASSYSVKTSGFEKTRGMLRSKGLIEAKKGSARASAILFSNKE